MKEKQAERKKTIFFLQHKARRIPCLFAKARSYPAATEKSSADNSYYANFRRVFALLPAGQSASPHPRRTARLAKKMKEERAGGLAA
jgi:hypothetical protein